MENLISMTDFVLEQERDFNEGITGWKEYTNSTINYAKLLKQPLELWMFVPCGKDAQPLKIIPFKEHQQGSNYEFMQHELYRQAKERCLFEGFTFNRKDKYCYYLRQYDNYTMIILKETIKTIEDIIESDLKLTETAKKMLF